MNLQLTEQEVQLVVNTLAQRPYAEVYTLIASISTQIAKANEPQKQE